MFCLATGVGLGKAGDTVCAKNTEKQHSLGVEGSRISLEHQVHGWGTRLAKELGGSL